MRTFKQAIIWSVLIFTGLTLLTMKSEAISDGIDAYGFPLTFYDHFEGKCDKCYDQYGFHLLNFLSDIGLSFAISLSLVVLKNTILKHGIKQPIKPLDRISISLKVTAVQMKQDIWMQGELEITINGQKPGSEDDIVESHLLFESMETNGEYFIFSCNCGIPACSGWVKGINVVHEGNIIIWTDLNDGRKWVLDKIKMESDLTTIRKEVMNFKRFFKKKEIEYVGIGYDW